ncbi:MAG: hypothetical protein ACK55I_31265, partial [bacterium]
CRVAPACLARFVHETCLAPRAAAGPGSSARTPHSRNYGVTAAVHIERVGRGWSTGVRAGAF